jgi:hypothetical protein
VSDAQLNVLNYALLALIYLFFARVLWAVWSEVRGPRPGVHHQPAAARGAASAPVPGGAATVTATRTRGKRGVPTRLVVLQPKVRKGSAYPIGGELTIGRSPNCAIGLPDDTFASGLHARVFRRDGAVWVEDLGSTNGTHLNGGRLEMGQQLVSGDRLQVGSTIFEAE